MKIQSAKAKGRNLQKWVVKELKETFDFTDNDVRSTPISTPGPDVLMSDHAQETFPFNIECKAQERFKQIYDIFNNIKPVPETEGMGRLLFLKMNNQEPLVVMDAHLMIKLFGTALYLYGKYKRGEFNDDKNADGHTIH